jgi:hypothetical protein
LVGFFKSLAGDRVLCGQFFAHADGLRSLAREEEGD